MSKIIIKISLLSLLLITIGGSRAVMATNAVNDAINSAAEAVYIATEQRSLSQAMLKNYVLSGLGVRSRKADKALIQAMADFNQQQQLLDRFITDTQVRQQLAIMAQRWQQVEVHYKQTPSKQHLLALYAANESLLIQADEVLNAMATANLSRVTPMLNFAGQQALLCHRLSALYGMMAWGFRAEAEPSYKQVYSQFSDTLQALESVGENTPLIGHNLKSLQRQLERTQATATASQDTFLPGLVDRSAVNMLKKVDELQAEYLVLARSLDQ
ncbi:hypothetical protein [Amphritea balenae]|uniref:NarX-like N-terminal domain-containing protein n=1 Tax=Amphritea balenae TaxID=452629 RepID=A0A3P1SQ87_9GAMM|nr:hypothetical protein [Amphritea balenae]RRC98805.1 hypothetical protein EHS89_11480 [Amphritea balenae]